MEPQNPTPPAPTPPTEPVAPSQPPAQAPQSGGLPASSTGKRPMWQWVAMAAVLVAVLGALVFMVM